MKCRKFKERFILYFYQELSEKETEALQTHLHVCPDCAKKFEETRKMFHLLDATRPETLPEANWEKCWSEIDAHLDKKKRSRSWFFPYHRWVYAGAALLLAFIIGIGIGRFWLRTSVSPGFEGVVSQNALQISLQQHLGNLKPVLVEYSNYNVSQNGRRPVLTEREVIQNLLIQNYLLKKVIADSDPSAVPLLEDLGLVLREIANQKPKDSQSLSQIKNLIDQREVLFRLEIFSKI